MKQQALDYAGPNLPQTTTLRELLLPAVAAATGLASIAGGWIFILCHADSGRLFQEGGWQWFASNFPFKTVRVLGAAAIMIALVGIIRSRRAMPALPGILLGIVGMILPHRW